MKSFTSRFGYCLVLCLGLNVSTAAQVSGPPQALFNGYSLEGWAKADGSQHPGWIVEDGALFRKSGGGDLFHEAVHRDFELHFQWKISEGGNSGLKYRVKKYGNAWLGCEYQVLDDQNAKERNKAGWLYDVYETAPNKPTVYPDTWNTGKIVVCGNRIEHWLNGVQVVQAQVGGDEWNERVAKSKFRNREGFGANREGRIFLQDHGNPVWYRNIVLVPLNCDRQVVATNSVSSPQSPCLPRPGRVLTRLRNQRRGGCSGATPIRHRWRRR